jgi:hypothetical protein
METRIITLSTRRSDYSIKEAAEDSMTVEELIEELRYLPGDCKVVFKNDNGYTYGYIMDRDIDSEYIQSEDEEEDPEDVLDRADMERDISEAVRKSEDGSIRLTAVWDDESKREFQLVGFNSSRVLGVTAVSEEVYSEFIPIEELSDSEVEDVWDAITF